MHACVTLQPAAPGVHDLDYDTLHQWTTGFLPRLRTKFLKCIFFHPGPAHGANCQNSEHMPCSSANCLCEVTKTVTLLAKLSASF